MFVLGRLYLGDKFPATLVAEHLAAVVLAYRCRQAHSHGFVKNVLLFVLVRQNAVVGLGWLVLEGFGHHLALLHFYFKVM